MPGHGARFFFSTKLPPAHSESTAASDQRWAQVVRLAPDSSVRALVVDDLALDREILVQMLQKIGAEVRLVESGEQALEQLREDLPDIVFLDIHMPDMEGPETLRHIRASLGSENLKVIAISASVLVHEQRRYVEAGFDGFIDKPLRVERIYACLAEQLGAEYEYEETGGPDGGPDGTESAPDLDEVALPLNLLDGLKEAARTHNMSDLRRQLDAVEALGGASRQLAEELRSLSQKFDMKAIGELLDHIRQDGG